MCVCSTAVTTAKADGTLRASLIVSSIILCVCWSIYLLVWGSQFKQPVQPSWRRLWSLIWVNILIQHLEHITSALLGCRLARTIDTYKPGGKHVGDVRTSLLCQCLLCCSLMLKLNPSIPNTDAVKTELYRSLNSELCCMLKLWTDIFRSLHVLFWRCSYSPVWGPKCSGSGFHLHLPVPSDWRFVFLTVCSCPVWWLWEESRMFQTASFSNQRSDHALNLSCSPCPWKRL